MTIDASSGDGRSGTDLAQRFMQALRAIESEGSGAVDAMVALFGESATLANAALDQAGSERHGRDGARTFWTSYADAFTGAATEFSHVTLGSNAIGLFWVTTGGTAPTGGAPLAYAGATLIEHDADGAITRFRGYYDSQALKVPARAAS